MNKTFCKKKYSIILLIAGCLILFNSGCGLDVFYVIEAPNRVISEPIYTNQSQDQQYFEFETKEISYEGIKFLGTEVYYKIYDNSSRLVSEYGNINSIATSENTANQSADRMIDNYKFQPLRSSNNTGANILIPDEGINRKVRIRLSNYNVYEAEYSISEIEYDDKGNKRLKNNGAPVKQGIPVRYISKNPTFSFKELIGTDFLPKGGDNGDDDYSYTNTNSDIKEYYVSMFAVAIAQDTSYSRQYSNVVYLGSVTISME